MAIDLPIACSLSATELPHRLADMADLGRAALLHAHNEGLVAELRFAAQAGVRGRVEAIAAAESRCCAFLRLRVSDEPGTVVLTIRAPDGTQAILAEFVDAFRGQSRAA